MTRLWMIFPIKTSMKNGSPAGHPGCPAPLASSTLLASLFGPAGNRRWEPRAFGDLEKFQYVVARPSQRRFLDQHIYIHRWHRYTYYQIVVVISSNNNHSVYLYVYICVRVCMCTWNHRTSQFAKACAYIHSYIYVYMYIYIYMCVSMCIYIYTWD